LLSSLSNMTTYSVQEVADFSGVSVRTLHHYDEIGLLVPAQRKSNGTRVYNRQSLYRLQQILLYKKAGFSLKKIDELLGEGAPQRAQILKKQRLWIVNEQKRLTTLLNTINRTIDELENEEFMMTEKELYEGLSTEEIGKRRKEVKDRWGEEELTKSETHIRQMKPNDFKTLKEEGENIVKAMAKSMSLPIDHPETQEKVDQYFEHMKRFRPELDLTGFEQLAHLYVDDDQFKAYYEKYAEGLADYVSRAIIYFCK